MAKQAKLADGTILQFPDETPDSVMDATVKKHLGVQEEPGMLSQVGNSALQSLGGAESLVRMPWNVLAGSAAKGIRTGAEMLAGNPLDYSLARGDESAQAISIDPKIKSSAGVDEMLGKAYEGVRSTAGEIASSGPGWNPNMKGGDAELLLKNEAANRSLGEMGLDTMAFKGVENLRGLAHVKSAPVSPYAAAKKAMGVEHLTDAEFVDLLEAKKKGVPVEEKPSAGPLQNELPLVERNDPLAGARESAAGEIRTLLEQQEFLRREQTGTKDMFQDTGLEKEATGLEPKKETQGGTIEPEGIPFPDQVETGLPKTRETIQDTGTPDATQYPLRAETAAERPASIPYSNTIFDYVYSRFPELTEKIARDPVANRLMTEVEKWTDHMKATMEQAGSALTGGVRTAKTSIELMPGVKTEGPRDIVTSKRAQAEMDRLKAEYERSAQRLDVAVRQLSERLKSTSKGLGSDIANNAKFADWVNERIGSSGPTSPGKDYVGKPYIEGAASGNLKKSGLALSPSKEGKGLPLTNPEFHQTLVDLIAKGDTRGVIDHIVANSKSKYLRELADALSDMGILPTIREGNTPFLHVENGKLIWKPTDPTMVEIYKTKYGAWYEPVVHGITIRSLRDLEVTILHELTHAATQGALYKYENFRMADVVKIADPRERAVAHAVLSIKELMSEVQSKAKGKWADTGFSNVYEFITYGLTDPSMGRWLDKQTISSRARAYLGETYKNLSNWGQIFMKAVSDIMGWKGTPTSFEALLAHTRSIIENQSQATQMHAFTDPMFEGVRPIKDGFQEFKDSLPKPYQHMAESLWKDRPEAKVETSFTNDKQLVVADTLKSITGIDNNYTPLTKPFKEVRDYLMGGEDINGSKLGQLLVSGGKMYAQQTKSRVIKYATDVINASKRAQEVATYNKLFAKDGIISSWERLTKAEQGTLWDYVKQYKFKEWRTTEQMTKDGFSPKQIEAYQAGKRHLEQTINEINAERVVHGEKEITPMPGYFPSRWKGNFYFEVNKIHSDGRKELVRIETGDRKGIKGLEGTRQRFIKEHPEYEVSDLKERPRYGDMKDTYSLFDNLLDTIGRDHPDRPILDSVFEQYSAESADKTRNFRRHFDINTGVEGYRGDTLGKNSYENAKDALYSLEGYMRDAHNYVETKRSAREINAMLNDKELTDKNPNAMKYIRNYWDFSNGVEPAMAKMFDYLPEQLALSLGFGRYTPKTAVQMMKKNMMIFFLGFNRPVFLLSQAVQPVQFMTPYLLRMKTELGIKGFDGMIITSQTKGYFDTSMALTYPEKMTALGKEAFKYATDQRIVDPHFLDEIGNAGNKTASELTKLVTGQTALQFTEKYARLNAYLQFTHLLEKSGVKGEALFKAAGDATDIAMTNYVTHERAMVYKHFGIVGDLASPLTTFKHNYFSQLYMYGKEALKHPTDINYSKPLLAFLMTQYAVGGFMGLPGRQELDWIIDLAREHGAVDPRTRNVTQMMMDGSAKMQHGKDVIRYGVFSAATGMDVSPTFSAANLIPERGISQLFPVVGKVAEIVGNAANVGGKGIGRVFGGQGSTAVDRAQLIKSVIPPAFKVGAEMINQNPKTGMIPNPNDHMTGDVRRGPPSIGDKNWQASALGTNSIPESEQRGAAWQSKLQEDAIKTAKQKIIGQVKDLQTSGQNWTKQAQKYMELGGSMNELVNAVKQNQMDQNQTREERARGIPKNVGGAHKFQRMEDYGVTK